MTLDIFSAEFFMADSIYGVTLLGLQPVELQLRSLFSFHWCDRECYLSVLYFTFNWTCLIGWEESE